MPDLVGLRRGSRRFRVGAFDLVQVSRLHLPASSCSFFPLGNSAGPIAYLSRGEATLSIPNGEKQVLILVHSSWPRSPHSTSSSSLQKFSPRSLSCRCVCKAPGHPAAVGCSIRCPHAYPQSCHIALSRWSFVAFRRIANSASSSLFSRHIRPRSSDAYPATFLPPLTTRIHEYTYPTPSRRCNSPVNRRNFLFLMRQ